jgi:uncharacterized protein
MKFLLMLALLAVVFFMLGARRGRPGEPEARSRPQPPAQPKAMLRCAECGMHLPADEALPGKGGVFCGAEHRNRFEAKQGQR